MCENRRAKGDAVQVGFLGGPWEGKGVLTLLCSL